jgi:hypothetical protein
VTPAVPIANPEVTVAFNHGQTEHFQSRLPFPVNDFEIPGMAMFPSSNTGSIWSTYQTPSSMSPTSYLSMSEALPTVTRGEVPEQAYQDVRPRSMGIDYIETTIVASQPNASSDLAATSPLSPGAGAGTMFRPSKWEWQSNYAWLKHPNNYCQTSIFRK